MTTANPAEFDFNRDSAVPVIVAVVKQAFQKFSKETKKEPLTIALNPADHMMINSEVLKRIAEELRLTILPESSVKKGKFC